MTTDKEIKRVRKEFVKACRRDGVDPADDESVQLADRALAGDQGARDLIAEMILESARYGL